MNSPLLKFTKKGIYCPIADVYLDPWQPVPKALITHSHSDHARFGSTRYITCADNVPILKYRLGPVSVHGIPWGKTTRINGVNFSFHPAGHILGSAQIRVSYKGEVWVFSGDYKTENDQLSVPFEPQRCHTFITECTFGIPAFRWKPQNEIFQDIITWWNQNQRNGRASVLLTYSLGKAQRILAGLKAATGDIYTHGAIENMTEVLRNQVELPPTQRITANTQRTELEGKLILAPPGAQGTAWIKRLPPHEVAAASGWMALRGNRRRRAVDRGFMISDHADWNGLLNSVKETGAQRVFCTHGYTEIFARVLQEQGLDAQAVQTKYEGENQDSSSEIKEDAIA
ncbi:MAG: hypothetical protein RLZZ241_884 [Bacteroidota bacterium]|jgi:putative mRNA 3-end processing factor